MLEKVPRWSERIEPYWDPKLRHNKKAYNELVKRLHGIHYFKYTTQPACKVGGCPPRQPDVQAGARSFIDDQRKL